MGKNAVTVPSLEGIVFTARDVTDEVAPGLRTVGMVTDAAWADVRGSEALDLVVVGGGPAGLAASVYGASEGLSTLCLDALRRRLRRHNGRLCAGRRGET